MKTLYRVVAVTSLLSGLALAAQAQTVIGSWQSAPIPPTPAYDEGWQRGQSGFGPAGSIFASSNCPSAFDIYANVAAGYSQSLVIHETGYGNVRLFMQLSASQIAAWTNNPKLNFTFSCQPGDTNTTDGYMQMVDFQYNSDISGWHNGTPAASHGWSATGDTNNNSSGQPIFYWWTTAPARQQVVTWDHSGVNFVGSSYVQLVWVFQVGGHAPTNIFLNNINLSGGVYVVPTIVVDQFNATNNPYCDSAIYANGDITNIYANWFGNAFSNVQWDATMDAPVTAPTPAVDPTNLPSGSMKITASWGPGDQFLVWDRGPGNVTGYINPPITNGLGLLTFEADVKFDPSSATTLNGSISTNYGHLQFGVVPPYNQDIMGAIDVLAGNTNWVHVSLPISARTDPNLMSVQSYFVKIDGNYYQPPLSNHTILWVDNVAFTYTNITIIPPPTVAIEPARPALRIFVASTGNTWDREMVATLDQNQSWVTATPSSPVSYSFTLLSFPPNGINQTHIFLIPLNHLNGGAYGNEYVDWGASNILWLSLVPAGGGSVTANIRWKTNLTAANPDHNSDLLITNATAIGTWTLTFTSPTDGSVTAPGAAPVAFTLSDPNAATDFGNPMVAYFGLQPNSTSYGLYEDWGGIYVTNVAGYNESEDFTQEPDSGAMPVIGSTMWSAVANGTEATYGIVYVSTNLPAYWVNWTLPAANYTLGTSTNVAGTNWIDPRYYSGYAYDVSSRPLGWQEPYGANNWVLLPPDALPTADGLQYGVGSGVRASPAFFLVATNVVAP
jgi:hypothetical protein